MKWIDTAQYQDDVNISYSIPFETLRHSLL